MRKLVILNRAKRLDDLHVPPDNRLEALKGPRKGQYSIRINAQWRICFEWRAWECRGQRARVAEEGRGRVRTAFPRGRVGTRNTGYRTRGFSRFSGIH